MKSGKTLTELAQEIERRANAKKDVVVNTKNLSMFVAGQKGKLDDVDPATAKHDGELRLSVGDQFAVGVNGIAHQQVAEYCDIPKKYYDRMLTADAGLLATNVNAWFGRDPQTRLVRTMDNNARAFLSDKYRPMENEELAEAVLPVLMDMDVAIMSAEITDRRLYIKAVDKKVERELKAIGGKFGDGGHNIVRCMSPAITISNSEVGMGALSILGGVYDGFCSNLATFGERSARKYHAGARHQLGGDEIYALLSDNTRKLSDQALWAQVRDLVRAAFERAKFDALCEKIAETQTQKIEGDTVKVVNLAVKRLGMTEGEGGSILKHLIEGGDLSRFGLYNAVTRFSQDVTDYDRATELERAGAQVLELPASEWRELAKAA